jgi:hypothetical protein
MEEVPGDLATLLEKYALSQHAAKLVAGGVTDAQAFGALSMSELKRLGFDDLTDRKRVMMAVRDTGTVTGGVSLVLFLTSDK